MMMNGLNSQVGTLLSRARAQGYVTSWRRSDSAIILQSRNVTYKVELEHAPSFLRALIASRSQYALRKGA